MAKIFTIHDFPTNQDFRAFDDVYILDSAEAAGLDFPFSDRAGLSPASLAYLHQGQVDNSDQTYLTKDQLHAGFFLTDTAYPKSNLVIDSDAESVFRMLEEYNADPFRWQRPVIF